MRVWGLGLAVHWFIYTFGSKGRGFGGALAWAGSRVQGSNSLIGIRFGRACAAWFKSTPRAMDGCS